MPDHQRDALLTADASRTWETGIDTDCDTIRGIESGRNRQDKYMHDIFQIAHQRHMQNLFQANVKRTCKATRENDLDSE